MHGDEEQDDIDIFDVTRENMAQIVDTPKRRAFMKEIGHKGWLGMTWPVEHGGHGRSPLERFAIYEVLIARGAPIATSWFADRQIGPTLLQFGTPEQRERFLPDIIAGTSAWSIGMSEPDAGSDVASIRTRAVRDGDDWVINGRKMWITSGTQADWLCLLARTSDEGGYSGMSMIVVPTDSPGFSVGRKIEKLGNRSSDTAELVFEDLRVPVANTIGEAGRGFQQQMAQFQDERLLGAFMSVSSARHALDRTKDYLRQRDAFGKPLLANQYLQYRLAELYADPKIKVTSFWTMGFNQHTRGTWANNMIYNIHLLVGKISEPGNSPFSLTGQPSACGTAREVGTFSHRLPADMVVTNPEHRKRADQQRGTELTPGHWSPRHLRRCARARSRCCGRMS